MKDFISKCKSYCEINHCPNKKSVPNHEIRFFQPKSTLLSVWQVHHWIHQPRESPLSGKCPFLGLCPNLLPAALQKQITNLRSGQVLAQASSRLDRGNLITTTVGQQETFQLFQVRLELE